MSGISPLMNTVYSGEPLSRKSPATKFKPNNKSVLQPPVQVRQRNHRSQTSADAAAPCDIMTRKSRTAEPHHSTNFLLLDVVLRSASNSVCTISDRTSVGAPSIQPFSNTLCTFTVLSTRCSATTTSRQIHHTWRLTARWSVTQNLFSGHTMTMQWSPSHVGRWFQ
jgi:hypothetical protein